MSLESVRVKEDHIERLTGLYMEHEVNKELVLGPEQVLPSDTSLAPDFALDKAEIDIEEQLKPEVSEARCTSGVTQTTEAHIDEDVSEHTKNKKHSLDYQSTQYFHEDNDFRLNCLKQLAQVCTVRLEHMPLDKLNECKACKLTFQCKSMLLTHKKVHEQQKLFSKDSYKTTYNCDNCKKMFVKKLNLIKHTKTCTVRLLSCKICNRHYSMSDLQKHMLNHSEDKPYTNKGYVRNGRLLRHKETHTYEKPYCCKICKQRFKILKNLHRHQLAHTGDLPCACDICGKRYRDNYNVKRHMQAVHSELDQYTCVTCQHQFSNISALMAHKEIHTEPYTCDICEKRYKSKLCLAKHIKGHANKVNSYAKRTKGNRCYACNVCNKQLSSLRSLKRHETVHTGNKQYACSFCNKTFAYRESLQAHERVHTGAKPYKCMLCNEQFAQRGNLATHVQCHTGDKPDRPFGCKFCEKRFGKRNHLNRHERIHTDKEPYSCKICSERCSDSSCLAQHLKYHSDVKQYKCDVCEKRFFLNYELTVHRQIHREEKPYVCDICGWSYADSISCYTHMRTHQYVD